jgi:hypothetical protein
MRGGVHYHKKNSISNKFFTIGRRSGNWRSAGKQKPPASGKQNNKCSSASNAQPNSFYGMHFGGGIPEIHFPLFPLCFLIPDLIGQN